MTTDTHDHHRMDTNGFGNHEAMQQQTIKTLLKAAVKFAEHLHNGGHANCDETCPIYVYFTNSVNLYQQHGD